MSNSPLPRYNKVLIIEDDEIDSYISRRIIVSDSFAKEVEIRRSAGEGLEYLRTAAINLESLPEFIFLDLEMPVVDGYAFLREFDSLPEVVRESCKVVILTNALSSEPEKAKALIDCPYIDLVFRKPLTSDAL